MMRALELWDGAWGSGGADSSQLPAVCAPDLRVLDGYVGAVRVRVRVLPACLPVLFYTDRGCLHACLLRCGRGRRAACMLLACLPPRIKRR